MAAAMEVDQASAKRKLEEGAVGGNGAAANKRMEVDEEAQKQQQLSGVPQLKNEDFSPRLLRIYYDKLFPFQQMFRWLSYRNDPKSDNKSVQKDFFLRREFTFVLAGDIYCRYQCFKDAEEYKQRVMSQQPVRMEIGAVFSHPPKMHNTIIKDSYKPVERELVFDIDMDDYDDIRTCCTGSKLCLKCWTFMKAAIKVLERALKDDFGFKHFMFVYSGRRGVHCWIGDKQARQLTNEQRSAVAEYLNLVTPGKNKAKAELKMWGCEELHPSIAEAHRVCEHYFKYDERSVLKAQDILRQGPHLSNILETMGVPERERIEKFVNTRKDATSVEIWEEFEKLAEERNRKIDNWKAKAEAKLFLKDIVIQYTYPRLDINVSKQMNHLLKSPFVVHPKTGRVCVPIDPANLDKFDPAKVPTVGLLAEELDRTGDPRQTSLKDYLHFFEINFLKPLEDTCLEELKGSGPGVYDF